MIDSGGSEFVCAASAPASKSRTRTWLFVTSRQKALVEALFASTVTVFVAVTVVKLVSTTVDRLVSFVVMKLVTISVTEDVIVAVDAAVTVNLTVLVRGRMRYVDAFTPKHKQAVAYCWRFLQAAA